MNSPHFTRRSLTATALWTPPVAVLATATPAFAASTAPLGFGATSYEGANGGTITGIEVTVRPAAATTLSLTLSGGFTFASRSSAAQITTDASGTATLPTILVPRTGGTGILSATDPASSSVATAALAARMTNVEMFVLAASAVGAAPSRTAVTGIPTHAVPLGASYYLDGADLWHVTGSATTKEPIARGVTKAVTSYGTAVHALNAAGQAVTIPSSGSVVIHQDVPVGSTPVGCGYFLSGTTLYKEGTLVATGILQAIGYIGPDGYPYVDAVKRFDSGVVRFGYYSGADGSRLNSQQPVSGGSGTILLSNLFYIEWGTAYYMGSARVSSVASAAALNAPQYRERDLAVVTTSGQAMRIQQSGALGTNQTLFPAVPAGARAVGGNYFLTGTDLWFGNAKVATDVLHVAAHGNSGGLRAEVVRMTV